MDLTRFGANLRKLLALHDLTGAQAAKVLGTTPQAVSAWLQGRRPPSSKSLFAIGQVFGIDPTRLANEDTQTLLSPVWRPRPLCTDPGTAEEAAARPQGGSLK